MQFHLLFQGSDYAIKCSSYISKVGYSTSNYKGSLAAIRVSGSTLEKEWDYFSQRKKKSRKFEVHMQECYNAHLRKLRNLATHEMMIMLNIQMIIVIA